MSKTSTIRLGPELSAWLDEQAQITNRSRSSLVKEALAKLRTNSTPRPFLNLAGSVDGPADLSQRKGFSRS